MPRICVKLLTLASLICFCRARTTPADAEVMPKPAAQGSGHVNLDYAMENFTKYRTQDLRIRCEISGSPLPNYRWFLNGTEINNQIHGRVKIKTTIWGSRLKMSQVEPSDSGVYKCLGFNQFGRAQTSGFVLVMNKLPPNTRTDPPDTAGGNRGSEGDGGSTGGDGGSVHVPNGGGIHYRPPGTGGSGFGFAGGGRNEPFCQPYRGAACNKFLKGKNIYVTSKRMQGTVEDKLMEAINSFAVNSPLSAECTRYAIPALCHYAFPECQGPNYKPRPRQICKDECLMLQNNVCKREYVHYTSRRNYGLSFSLFPDCNSLPSVSSVMGQTCLRLMPIHVATGAASTAPTYDNLTPPVTKTLIPRRPGVKENQRQPVEDVDCYRGDGSRYRGTVSTTTSNIPCQNWRDQSPHPHIEVKSLVNPNLDGNYCRNPGGKQSGPWCYTTNPLTEKELCDVPKCVYVKSGKSGKDSNLLMILLPSLGVPIAIVTLLVVVCLCHRNRRNKKANNNRKVIKNGASHVEMNSLLTGSTKVKEFPVGSIRFLQQLGEGDFGRIYQGDLIGLYAENSITRVAIKTLKDKVAPKLKNDFRREVDRMSDIKHPNILCLVGVCMKEEPWCMLFECMMQGDLHQFLSMHSPHSDVSLSDEEGKQRRMDYREMLHLSIQIASGMEYLGSRRFIHKDVAARNVLVGDNLTVKISDLGLAKDLYPGDYYLLQNQTLLPIRWMPPESILYGKFSVESDVWAFGVTLWEIHSHGLQPYYGYNNQEAMDMIRARQILPCPEDCPSRVYSLMVECWQENATRRPSFREIHTRLIGWMGEMMGHAPHLSASLSGHSSSHHSSHHSSTGPSNNTATTVLTPSTNTSQSPVPHMMLGIGSYHSTPVHCVSPPPGMPYMQQNCVIPQQQQLSMYNPAAHYGGGNQGGYIVTPGYTNNVATMHYPSPPASLHSHKTPSHSSSRSSSLANCKPMSNKPANHRLSDKQAFIEASNEIEEVKQTNI